MQVAVSVALFNRLELIIGEAVRLAVPRLSPPGQMTRYPYYYVPV